MVEIPKKILSDLNFVLVEHMDEVIEHALRPVVKRKRRPAKKQLVRSKRQK
jgi:ATP-dependent Lon protease